MAIMALKLMNLLSVNRVLYQSFAGFCDCKNVRVLDVLSKKHIGSHMTIKGWIKSVRKLKENLFIDVNDGSCTDKLQVVLKKSMKPDHLSFGAAIEVEGVLDKNDNDQLELKAEKLAVVGPCGVNEGYPFAGKVVHPPDYVRKFLHLRSRTNQFNAMLRVRDATTKAIHSYFGRQGYINIHTPILTSNDCEGAGEVFVVRPENEILLTEMVKLGKSLDSAYFDTKVFLTVSGQLHLEGIARGLGNVYTFGPTFRAENSRSRLHLSEFYMIEAEAVFMNELHDLLKIIENFIKEITVEVLNKCERDVAFLQDKVSELHVRNLLEKPFQVLSFNDACSLVNKHFDGPRASEKENLNKEQELFLVDYLGKVPVFVVEWPQALKPFYMKQMPNSDKVAAVDLLVPNVGELCGGSVRESNHDLLRQKLQERKLLKALDWYLDIRKYGNVSTVGFGMGFERFLQMFLGVGNIKDTIPFPRWPHNCRL